MTKKPHDQFSKLYLKGMLSPFGQEVEISFELPAGESQQVDVWFIPKTHQPIVELGLLGKMATTPALLEVFRNPISEDDLFACFEKLCKVRGELKRTARREKRKLLVHDKPHLWLIVPTASKTSIEDCNAKFHRAWGEGFFFFGKTLRIGFVVVHQLPVVPETLFLRMLGRGKVQTQAFAELLQLPEQPLKIFALEKFTKLQLMIKNQSTISKDDREILSNIDVIYEEWRNTTKQEGHKEGHKEADRASLVGLLVAKFGVIDPELEAVIPQLLTLDPTERARSVMTLSREALLQWV
jgi:hypothetical protein